MKKIFFFTLKIFAAWFRRRDTHKKDLQNSNQSEKLNREKGKKEKNPSTARTTHNHTYKEINIPLKGIQANPNAGYPDNTGSRYFISHPVVCFSGITVVSQIHEHQCSGAI